MARASRQYVVSDYRQRLARAFPFRILPAHTEAGHFYEREDNGRVAASVTTKLGFVSKGYLYKWYAKMAVEHVRENLSRLLAGDASVLDDAQRAGEKSRDDSAGIGTTAHGAIDNYCSHWIHGNARPRRSASDFLVEGANGAEIAACRSFDKFLDENEVIPLASELKIWYENGRDCYAGTIDTVLLALTTYKGRAGERRCLHDYSSQPSGIWWCSKCKREAQPRLILGDVKTSNTIKGKDEYAHQTVAYAKAIEKALGDHIDDIWVIRFGKAYAEYEVLKVSNRAQAWAEWLSISRAYDRMSERVGRELLGPLVVKERIRI